MDGSNITSKWTLLYQSLEDDVELEQSLLEFQPRQDREFDDDVIEIKSEDDESEAAAFNAADAKSEQG